MANGTCVCLVGVLLVAAQPVGPLASYQQRIEAYRAGTGVSEADLARPAVAGPLTAGWPSDDLEAAAMLQTDVGLRLVKTGRHDESAPHFAAAAALLRAAVDLDVARVEYARRWRDTVSGLLEASGAGDLARDVETRGRELWPESKEATAARAAIAEGLTHEIQAAVAGRLSGPPPTRSFVIPPDAISALHHASANYAAALESDPTNTQAALHLGRVDLILGRDADAVPRLRAASASPNSSVGYLAFMFLGAIEERAGRLDAAMEQYRHASAAFRWGQSAPMALSHALMRAGRETDAREVLADHFNATHGRVCEPLWTYLADPSTDLGPTLDEMRAEIWK